jgi:hypothetical protein
MFYSGEITMENKLAIFILTAVVAFCIVGGIALMIAGALTPGFY